MQYKMDGPQVPRGAIVHHNSRYKPRLRNCRTPVILYQTRKKKIRYAQNLRTRSQLPDSTCQKTRRRSKALKWTRRRHQAKTQTRPVPSRHPSGSGRQTLIIHLIGQNGEKTYFLRRWRSLLSHGQYDTALSNFPGARTSLTQSTTAP
jgi:hypothetical protein